MHTRFWLQDLEGIDCLEVRVVDASIILKESYRNRLEWCGQDFIWLRIGASGGTLEKGDVLLDLMSCWEMADQLQTY